MEYESPVHRGMFAWSKGLCRYGQDYGLFANGKITFLESSTLPPICKAVPVFDCRLCKHKMNEDGMNTLDRVFQVERVDDFRERCGAEKKSLFPNNS